MASICGRCALRLQRAAQVEVQNTPRRAFSSTRNHGRSLPTFVESTNSELNDVLATLQNKHFVPAAMNKRQRNMIRKPKYRQMLEDNPQTVTIGGQEIMLEPIDPQGYYPRRQKNVTRAIDLIVKGESKDWQNLPALLQGLNELNNKPLSDEETEKIVRKAVEAGRFGVIMQCLQHANRTNMTLQREVVLRSVLIALRRVAQRDDWSRESTRKALKDANVIVSLLESEQHGASPSLRADDPRTQPKVLAMYLELASVWASKHQEPGENGLSVVRTYAQRLLQSLSEKPSESKSIPLLAQGEQHAMLQAVSIWHGIYLAQKLLGNDMPKFDVAKQITTQYETALEDLAQQLEARHPRAGSYDQRALAAWRECIRN